MRLFGTLIGASIDAGRHEADRFCGMAIADILGKQLADRSRVRCPLFGRAPRSGASVRLPDTDGPAVDQRPGAISAQGARAPCPPMARNRRSACNSTKGARRVLTHTGYAHGGNGYEGDRVSSGAIPRFRAEGSPTQAYGIDLKALALRYVDSDRPTSRTRRRRAASISRRFRAENHPVFGTVR